MKYPIFAVVCLLLAYSEKSGSIELLLDNGNYGVALVRNTSGSVLERVNDLSTTLALIEYQYRLVDDEEINDKTISRCILSCVGRRRRRRRRSVPRRTFRCLGNLVSSNLVLTPAACVKYTGDYSPISVRLADRQDYEIESITVHENYRANIPENFLYAAANNVALIKLRQMVTFTSNVSPICLPVAKEMRLTTDLLSIEWQLTENKLLPDESNRTSTGTCVDKYDFEMTPVHVYGKGPLLAEFCGGWTAGQRKGLTSYKYLMSFRTRGATCGAKNEEVETVIGDHIEWIRENIRKMYFYFEK